MNERDELEKIRAHEEIWKQFYDRAESVLRLLGRQGSYDDDADFWIIGNDWGGHAVQIDLRNLDLLRPDVLEKLQASLGGDPDWSIAISVSLRDGGRQAPSMGLTIYCDEIIDELQRDYLPERFRNTIFGTVRKETPETLAARVRALMNKPAR